MIAKEKFNIQKYSMLLKTCTEGFEKPHQFIYFPHIDVEGVARPNKTIVALTLAKHLFTKTSFWLVYTMPS